MLNSLPDNNILLERTPDLVAADLDGELVMMNAVAGRYYGISGVGARAFELLESPISIEGLVETITHEYEVEADKCRRDLQAFVQELMANGLVRQVN
ncbi:PqqD family peptide modification chaperone [Halomonas sp. LR5S13]|uniref:PqqD family peptide modification chaperone n=1 Tax=Halomonas rhizosphaerae TaxID=3043296 RepID=UPI0024A9D298|nr:PqqD family peptide modification chaperone [Halomonas rhizosphaerae]MDI5921847.1 PqqD family peptide modification chaperone [Halomonas rhizosphaerae]